MVEGKIEAIVLCGPSGSGKSTLLRKLFQDFPDKFQFSVSHTTRKPRPGEVDGVHYYFTTREEMSEGINNGEFIENAEYSNNMYGTSRKSVEDCMKNGKLCVLDIDIQGVKQVKETDVKALYIFVKPPSLDSLAARLMMRGTETDETLQCRLNAAEEEIRYGNNPGNFDLVLLNDDIEAAYVELKGFVMDKLSNESKTAGEIQS